MAQVLFIGTGLIGAGMAEGALFRGDTVWVWNRSFAKAEALVKLGAHAVPHLRDAVTVSGLERIHLALSADDAVDSVLTYISAAVPEGVPVIDHSTTLPALTKIRAEKYAHLGFVHAPIFMSPQMCREAGGLMLASGPRTQFERVEAALSAMTKKLWWLGESLELAAAYKLFGNAMILTITGGLADVYAIGASLGITPEDAYQLFGNFKVASTLDIRGARMSKGDFDPSFAMTMARKDLRLMLQSAGEQPLAVLPGLAARMDQLIERGLGDKDVGALANDSVELFRKK
jgi:3-hydroxyisobutyrate dehydrogenase-like beta-hydroxyacid dehydrogenase